MLLQTEEELLRLPEQSLEGWGILGCDECNADGSAWMGVSPTHTMASTSNSVTAKVGYD